MKDFIFKYLKYFSVVFGAGVVFVGVWQIRGRVKRVWGRLRGDGAPRRPVAPRPTAARVPEPRVAPTVAKDAPPCLLLTCFEQQQPMFLEVLNFSDPGYTAFDSVVCLRVAGRVIYLTPPLFEVQAPLTWAVLRMASGTAKREAVPIQIPPEGKRVALSPQDAEVLSETTCYFGIDLAMIPLAEQLRTDLRTTLQQLQELLGPRLCVLECHKDVVDGWPSAQRTRRLEIWREIFKGLEIRKADTDVSRKSDSL